MEIIYSYSRADAIEDGMQFACPLAKEAGYKYPVYATCGVNSIINAFLQYGSNTYNGVLWDILIILRTEIAKWPRERIIKFLVNIYWEDGPKDFCFTAAIGTKDFDDPQPALTIMLPHED